MSSRDNNITRIDAETNPELHGLCIAQMEANRGATRITVGGREYRAYDNGSFFIDLGTAEGMKHYNNVSMSQGASLADVTEAKTTKKSKSKPAAGDVPATEETLVEVTEAKTAEEKSVE